MSSKKPSLLRQWLDIKHEEAMTHKALRLMKKQEWSVEFLTALLMRAANTLHRPLEMTIASPSGVKVTIKSTEVESNTFNDDNIFNHLDDEMRIKAFIERVNR